MQGNTYGHGNTQERGLRTDVSVGAHMRARANMRARAHIHTTNHSPVATDGHLFAPAPDKVSGALVRPTPLPTTRHSAAGVTGTKSTRAVR